MDGFGTIVSFETVGTAAETDAMCDRSRVVIHATSLGGVETSWERRRRWVEERPDIPETLIRLSVGIEDVDDLWTDISNALDTLTP
jgi:cystathionine gamma-synthase